ncbi:MAG: RNA methyltransferase [Gammaproteobacteria bacterium]|nr:RNA methyltransferase [Gammaproteobacteria bacterium]
MPIVGVTLLKQVRIVLVDCLYGGNIGRTVRAMKNMGLTDIALVRPREFPAKEAVIFAASAADMLEEAKVYDNLDDALSDRDLVVGTSSRSRSLPIEIHAVREGALKICESIYQSGVAKISGGDKEGNPEVDQEGMKVAILFGSEDRGLTNDELLRCRMHMFVPTDLQYPVLNLAMTVQIVCYELLCAINQLGDSVMDYPLQDGKVNTSNRLARHRAMPLADNEDMEHFYGHLESWLAQIDFFNPQKPATIMHKMRRIFNRVPLYANELEMLRGMITRSIQSISGVKSVSKTVKPVSVSKVLTKST